MKPSFVGPGCKGRELYNFLYYTWGDEVLLVLCLIVSFYILLNVGEKEKCDFILCCNHSLDVTLHSVG